MGVEVSSPESDAKILKQLFGGGYLEIRPCEGPRVQIVRRGSRFRTGSGLPGASRVRGSRRLPSGISLLTAAGRWVGLPFPLTDASLRKPQLAPRGAVAQLSSGLRLPLGPAAPPAARKERERGGGERAGLRAPWTAGALDGSFVALGAWRGFQGQRKTR